MPDPKVIAALKLSLEWAEEYNAQHVAVSLVGHKGFYGLAGNVMVEQDQLKAMKEMVKMLEASIDNWDYPPQDPTLDGSSFVYPVARGPLGYDFLVWLVNVEMRRRRSRWPGPLKIGLWCGRDADSGKERINRSPGDKELSALWVNNVFRPALHLLGAVEDDAAVKGHRSEVFTTKTVVDACRDGEEVPKFSATDLPPVPGNPYVTITLRESSHFPHRNSDIQSWYTFAIDLRAQGERVIFVRDTEKASERPLGAFETEPLASVYLDYRCALYAGARANFFVSNGPATLAVFGTAPWAMFVPIEEAVSHYQPNTAEFWKTNQGLDVGEQYPWSAANQRLVWKEPTYTNLCAAWDELKHAL